ncbi:MAG TPA: ATPase [Chloroflexota bacterium]|jgi:vacuolar-type H+-ATPase subunit H|nr:ATPase [Chloroflexota bacterium]
MTDVERGSQVEALALLDRLESLVSGGARVPLTSRSIVDEQEFIDLLDQIRASIPEEVRQAKRVSQEREKVILQAQSEADKIINTAREQATALLEENELVRLAHEQANAYVQDAIQRAEEIRRGADEYALAALDELEQHLTRLLATIRKGKAALERSLQMPMEPGGATAQES